MYTEIYYTVFQFLDAVVHMKKDTTHPSENVQPIWKYGLKY